MTSGDTIAAISTAPGRAGIAVVRISGAQAFELARQISSKPPLPGRITIANVRGENCVILAFKAPCSYTGEDVVEIQCHGGAIAPRRALEACFAAGARLARRGEFTERAFLNGKLGLEEAEAVIDLIDAKTNRAAERALDGLAGLASKRLHTLFERTMDLSVRIEHALDVDEEDLPDGFFQKALDDAEALAKEIEREMRNLREGKILRDGALVVLAGAPNAGKSSLMNRLLGENRAIVSATPGTTRDSIEEWCDIAGWPVRLVDTAGLRETDDAIESEGVLRAKDLMRKADVVIAFDSAVCGNVGTSSILRIHAKCDLTRSDNALNVSSLTGEGIDELKSSIAHALEKRADDASFSSDDSTEETLAVLALAKNDLADVKYSPDLAVSGNAVRSAASRIARLTGAEYSSDLLERLFSRFCVGK